MTDLVQWATSTIGATPVRADENYIPPYQGPTVIPFRNMSGRFEGVPHNPALYGRYISVDLDENNRHSVDAYCARFPDRPRPDLGWGVCRHGFGLQSFGDGWMSREVAELRAKTMNAGHPGTDVPNI